LVAAARVTGVRVKVRAELAPDLAPRRATTLTLSTSKNPQIS
jgi:hypothetical protein